MGRTLFLLEHSCFWQVLDWYELFMLGRKQTAGFPERQGLELDAQHPDGNAQSEMQGTGCPTEGARRRQQVDSRYHLTNDPSQHHPVVFRAAGHHPVYSKGM